MPGMRDRNLRSGDLHEELGIFLLKAVALVAPVPRQEDVGNDAFATLIRPDGGRRLIPDRSFLVQLKAASVSSVAYSSSDEIAWIRGLDSPLFIGRVKLKDAKIEVFTTLRLHEILLEHSYEKIELLLDSADEQSTLANVRLVNIGPPVHAWSVEDMTQSDFLERSYAILRPHVETLHRNRTLRGIQTLRRLRWETGQPPSDNGELLQVSAQCDISDTLRDMAPHVRRLLWELQIRKRYGDFRLISEFIDLMRRWGFDPDPGGLVMMLAGSTAEGPEISIEDVIRLREAFQSKRMLDLSRLPVSDEALAVIPRTVIGLALVNAPITDAGVPNFLKLTNLKRLNVAGTQISDVGLVALASLHSLEWICINRTQVTPQGVARLKANRPDLEVVIGAEPGAVI